MIEDRSRNHCKRVDYSLLSAVRKRVLCVYALLMYQGCSNRGVLNECVALAEEGESKANDRAKTK